MHRIKAAFFYKYCLPCKNNIVFWRIFWYSRCWLWIWHVSCLSDSGHAVAYLPWGGADTKNTA